MGRKKCAIRNCIDSGRRMFCFPNPKVYKERSLKWLEVADNKELLHLTPSQLYNRAVCSNHFEQKYFLWHKLAPSAVPTLRLPEKIDVPVLDREEDAKSIEKPTQQLPQEVERLCVEISDLRQSVREAQEKVASLESKLEEAERLLENKTRDLPETCRRFLESTFRKVDCVS